MHTQDVWPQSSMDAGKGAGKVVFKGLTKLARKHRMCSHGKFVVWDGVDCLYYGITNLKYSLLPGIVAHAFYLSSWNTEVGGCL